MLNSTAANAFALWAVLRRVAQGLGPIAIERMGLILENDLSHQSFRDWLIFRNFTLMKISPRHLTRYNRSRNYSGLMGQRMRKQATQGSALGSLLEMKDS